MPRGGSAAHRWYSVVVFVVLASLDNVAIALVPPLYESISVDLAVPKAMIGAVTAAGYLVSAVAAVVWAYVGDRTNRKPLLMAGTLLWAAGTAGTGLAGGYWTFLAAQLIAAVGLGAVGSVGFSVVTDLVAPRRRGLVLSFWGLSQGVGTLTGTLAGGLLGATDWRRPSWCSPWPASSPPSRTCSRTTSGAVRANPNSPGCSPPVVTTTTGSAAPTCAASSTGGPTSG